MILVVMIFSVMCVVGAILIGSVVDFYKKDFAVQMRENLSPNTATRRAYISDDIDNFYDAKKILASYGSSLVLMNIEITTFSILRACFLPARTRSLDRRLPKQLICCSR